MNTVDQLIWWRDRCAWAAGEAREQGDARLAAEFDARVAEFEGLLSRVVGDVLRPADAAEAAAILAALEAGDGMTAREILAALRQ
jgi:hypothetical protein